jgi:hypothetical protein
LPKYKEEILDCELDVGGEPSLPEIEISKEAFYLWSVVPQDCFQEARMTGIRAIKAPGAVSPVPSEATAGQFETNFDRFGMDYEDFESPNPLECQAACGGDVKCLAFAFSQPGGLFPTGHCWLKNGVPPPTPRSGFISGAKPLVKQAPRGELEMNTDRFGSDYKDFDSPKATQCRDECVNDAQCQAFTFSEAGALFPTGHCWLKDRLPPPTARMGFISGAKPATP